MPSSRICRRGEGGDGAAAFGADVIASSTTRPPAGYHEIDRELRIVNINRTACELVGYDPQELLGQLGSGADRAGRALDASAWRSATTVWRPARSTLVPSSRYSSQGWAALSSGDPGAPAPGDDGQIVGLQSVVTGHLQTDQATEAALVESDRRAGRSSTGSTMRCSCTIRKDASSTPIPPPAASSATAARNCWE